MPYPGTNGMAVAAASVSLLGIVPPLVLPMLDSGPLLILPIVGMVLGIIALVQLRRHPQGGRGMAITGIVLGAGVLALLSLGIAALLGFFGESSQAAGRPAVPNGAVTSPATSDPAAGAPDPVKPVTELEAGDCFDGVGFVVESVTPRSCQQAHEAEVITLMTLPEGAYPGGEKVEAMVRDGCAQQMYPLLDEAYVADLRIYAFYPQSEAAWSRSRTVTCIATPQDGTLDTSVLR